MDYEGLVSYNPCNGKFYWLKKSHKNNAMSEAGIKTEYGYIVINACKKRHRAHRLAWFLFYGWWPPKGFDIDHKNRIRDDNRICNLRIATRNQNSWNCNMHKDNTSGARGVCWHKKIGKWVARLHVDRKCVFYMEFSSFEDACEEIKKKRTEYYSEFRGSDSAL